GGDGGSPPIVTKRGSRRVLHQGDEAVRGELPRAAGEAPCTDLGPAQVLQDGHRLVTRLGRSADGGEPARVLLVRPVGEFEPRQLHAGADELLQRSLVVAGGADGTDDLRSPDQHGAQHDTLCRRPPTPFGGAADRLGWAQAGACRLARGSRLAWEWHG